MLKSDPGLSGPTESTLESVELRRAIQVASAMPHRSQGSPVTVAVVDVKSRHLEDSTSTRATNHVGAHAVTGAPLILDPP